MKLPAPTIVRRGVSIRVAEGSGGARPAVANSFVDVRHDVGYVERWIGAGALRDDFDPDDMQELVRWGQSVAADVGHEVFYELHREFVAPSLSEFEAADVEVVVSWNATDLC